MKIDLYIPPEIQPDLSNAAGYLVRCKPENDCASLFAPGGTTAMYTMLVDVIRDASKHAAVCPHEHAVVVIARGPVSVGAVEAGDQAPGQPKRAPTEPPLMQLGDGLVHPWMPDCEHGCKPVEA